MKKFAFVFILGLLVVCFAPANVIAADMDESVKTSTETAGVYGADGGQAALTKEIENEVLPIAQEKNKKELYSDATKEPDQQQ